MVIRSFPFHLFVPFAYKNLSFPIKILIDNGHGIQTKGKRSPDEKLLEYAYTREIAKRIVANLIDRGYDAELLVPEEDDIPLSERVRRVNEICLTYEPSCPAPTGHPTDHLTGHLTDHLTVIPGLTGDLR